ncbi:hypothetical protein BDV29DRAFT_176822 [Aspergillus leporis]|jgi:hypothetical protein|uniref:Uncharacterized protein n=1 Tax=Aspergillus leporis TaxID=41062 RepID=A0A5N5WZV1_9EURO|nr:hypothetical protein BDV29DRAFT_176822 [Aspergillus leporis]
MRKMLDEQLLAFMPRQLREHLVALQKMRFKPLQLQRLIAFAHFRRLVWILCSIHSTLRCTSRKENKQQHSCI